MIFPDQITSGWIILYYIIGELGNSISPFAMIHFLSQVKIKKAVLSKQLPNGNNTEKQSVN